VSSNPKCAFARNQLGEFMKSAKKVEYSDTSKYDKLVDLMRKRAAGEWRNLVGYVESK